jgi:hypothetical protein
MRVLIANLLLTDDRTYDILKRAVAGLRQHVVSQGYAVISLSVT